MNTEPITGQTTERFKREQRLHADEYNQFYFVQKPKANIIGAMGIWCELMQILIFIDIGLCSRAQVFDIIALGVAQPEYYVWIFCQQFSFQSC